MNDDREHFTPLRGSIAVNILDTFPDEATVTVEWSTGVSGWDPACLDALDRVEENAAVRGWRMIKRHMECKDLARAILRKSGTWAWAKELARSVYGGKGVPCELAGLDERDEGTHVTDIKLERS